MSATTPPIRIKSPGDLLSVMPYLIGHEPAESLVAMGLSGRKIAFIARTDLDVPVDGVAAELPRDVDLVLIAYSGSGSETQVRRLAHALSWHRVVSVLRVTDGRFYCLSCEDCTPPQGMPIDTATPAAAELVLQGIAPIPSRQAVDEMVAPIDGVGASEMLKAFGRAANRLRRTRLRIADARSALDNAVRLAQRGILLPDDEAAWLCLVLHDLPVRDIAWLATDSAQWQLEMWRDLTHRCIPAAVAPVASLLAWSAWRRGDGALAAAALNRAFAVEPDYGLANLIATALVHAMPPHTIGPWPPEDADLQQP